MQTFTPPHNYDHRDTIVCFHFREALPGSIQLLAWRLHGTIATRGLLHNPPVPCNGRSDGKTATIDMLETQRLQLKANS